MGFIAQCMGYDLEMLKGILGNASAEKVLLYIEQYGEGYAKAFEGTTLHMVQRQLERFEGAGLLVSTLRMNPPGEGRSASAPSTVFLTRGVRWKPTAEAERDRFV